MATYTKEIWRLLSAEVVFVTSWGYLRHFCTRDKYWRVAGYRSAHYEVSEKLATLILGFTLEAKLVSSKDLTQVHLKISSRFLENLPSHLMTQYITWGSGCQSSFVVNSVMHITNATARKCDHEAIATEKSVL